MLLKLLSRTTRHTVVDPLVRTIISHYIMQRQATKDILQCLEVVQMAMHLHLMLLMVVRDPHCKVAVVARDHVQILITRHVAAWMQPAMDQNLKEKSTIVAGQCMK